MKSRALAAAQVLAVFLGLSSPGASSATSWIEAPDAPEDPYAFQWTVGSGPLTDIQGAIFSSADRDAYCIEIVDRFSFTASIPCSDTGTHDLWLFRTDGFGVSGDDGCSGGLVYLSGANVFANGKYVLVISASENEPRSAGGQTMWAPPVVFTERAPDGPGAAGAFVDWQYTEPLFGGAEPYQISLTGCIPCDAAVPVESRTWGSIKRQYR